MRPFPTAAALCLALGHTTNAAGVPHSYLQAREVDAKPQPEDFFSRFISLMKRTLQPRQEDGNCLETPDSYYNFTGELGEDFCRDYMNYPNVTIPVLVTPTRYVQEAGIGLDHH